MHLMDSSFVRQSLSDDWTEECFQTAMHMIEKSIKNGFSLLVYNFHHYLLLNNLSPLQKFLKFYKEPKTTTGKKKNQHRDLGPYIAFLKWLKTQDVFITSMSQWHIYKQKRTMVHISLLQWNEKKRQLFYWIEGDNSQFSFSHMVPEYFRGYKLRQILVDDSNVPFKFILFCGRQFCLFNFYSSGEKSYNIAALYFEQ